MHTGKVCILVRAVVAAAPTAADASADGDEIDVTDEDVDVVVDIMKYLLLQLWLHLMFTYHRCHQILLRISYLFAPLLLLFILLAAEARMKQGQGDNVSYFINIYLLIESNKIKSISMLVRMVEEEECKLAVVDVCYHNNIMLNRRVTVICWLL